MIYLADSYPEFVQAIKTVENNIVLAKRSGEYKQTNGNGEWRWFPGKSPEGGLPTLAYGHKFTDKEWSEKKVKYIDHKLNQEVTKDFRYGLTDEEVNALLLSDLREYEDRTKQDWERYQKTPYDNLLDKYKGVLVNLCYNAGLVKKGAWVWKTVAAGIHANDPAKVVEGMVTTYKRPDGKRVRLTSRALEIAKALNLPTEALTEKK